MRQRSRQITVKFPMMKRGSSYLALPHLAQRDQQPRHPDDDDLTSQGLVRWGVVPSPCLAPCVLASHGKVRHHTRTHEHRNVKESRGGGGEDGGNGTEDGINGATPHPEPTLGWDHERWISAIPRVSEWNPHFTAPTGVENLRTRGA
ncbi:hypothetical protein Landi51_02453 [Colletotrichum acutatum]